MQLFWFPYKILQCFLNLELSTWIRNSTMCSALLCFLELKFETFWNVSTWISMSNSTLFLDLSGFLEYFVRSYHNPIRHGNNSLTDVLQPGEIIMEEGGGRRRTCDWQTSFRLLATPQPYILTSHNQYTLKNQDDIMTTNSKYII